MSSHKWSSKRRTLPPHVSEYLRIPALGALALAGGDRKPGDRVSPGRAVLLVYRELSICTDNGRRTVHYGRKALGNALKIGEQTARRALISLEDAGMIQKVFQSNGGRRWSNTYRVLKNVFASVVRDLSRIRARKNCTNNETATNPSTKGIDNRPPKGGYSKPPPPPPPVKTTSSEAANRFFKNLALKGTGDA